MKILLDIDGVMVTTPTWQQPEFLPDGFMAFDKQCAENLAKLITLIHANSQTVEIVITSTHRIHHDANAWQILLNNRDVFPDSVTIINEVKKFAQIGKRVDEIMAWSEKNSYEEFIILDDDKSLRALPDRLKTRWIECDFLTGFNNENLQKALSLLA